jgi:hypothetical protein
VGVRGAWWVAVGIGLGSGCGRGAVAVSRTAQLDAVVAESSGLAVSRRWPGVWWTHNDSGDTARVFAVAPSGALLREVPVIGAGAVDWEAVALDEQGGLWIGDVGNNDSDRRDLMIYRIDEPDPGGVAPAVVTRTIAIRFPDQTAFPDAARPDFDGEALFADATRLFLLTKHRSDLRTTLYEVPLDAGDDVVLEHRGEHLLGGDPDRFGGMATSADLHPSGRYLALLTYHALFVFERPPDGSSWLSRPVVEVALDQEVADQCEAVAWDGWSVVFTNEDGAIHRIDAPFHRRSWP